ncbi:Endonuclease/exonuclease/phosphatase [Flammula alnicola]|nr:Endonuclease/exonuclease/phosphatase [Flammula alnicola]
MRFVTYNLRFDSKPDNITVQQSLNALASVDPLQQPTFFNITKEQPWSVRRLRVADLLLSENIVLAVVQLTGFQEALIRQVRDLAELLGDEWAWTGVGRDDGLDGGEFSPIFYQRTKLKLLSSESFWLSNTPFEPSRFPHAGSIRVCTVAHFVTMNPKSHPREFTVLNTHLDDQSDDQRRLGASLLLTRAHFAAVKTNSPVFTFGDLNRNVPIPSTGADSGAYKIITGEITPVAISKTFAEKFAVDADQEPGFKMLDLRAEAPRRSVSANFATFTGFSLPNNTSPWTRIDFIFGGSNLGWNATGYRVGTSLSDDGMLASDHRPVFADVTL